MAADPLALLRSKSYVQLLVLAALIGAPISALAYGYLKLVAVLQKELFDDLPGQLGFASTPAWWPLPLLVIAGLLTAPAIRFLPGHGGHSPADGFKASGAVPPIDLPGIFAASLATLAFGAVLGPEAPLILMGSGLGVLAMRLAARGAPDRAAAIIAAAGSFAAISSLLGSPLVGAFLLLEAAGLGGPMLGVVLLPGLLAAGLGSLIFVGLDSLTGFGTLTLAIPDLPPVGPPTVTWLLWALAFGLVAPFGGRAITALAIAVRTVVEPRMLLAMPVLGLLIGGLAVAFDQVTTGHSTSYVLFSGQDAIGPLITGASGWSVGALLAVLAAKGLAYSLSLSSFRGGPVFPALFLGAAGGVAASHLPGLPLVPAVAMGIGAMSTTMLRLPLTSALLAALLLGSDGTNVLPVVIVAVVVSHVVTARLTPVHPDQVMTEPPPDQSIAPWPPPSPPSADRPPAPEPATSSPPTS
ncbi:MAG TPA: chloride channel protein [Baekduia sp.]